MGALAVLYLALNATGTSSAYPTLNQYGPVILLSVCMWASYRLVRRAPFALWSPVPWFFAASAAYFGFGQLAYHFANPESVLYMDAFHAIDQYTLLRTNLLNVAGIGSVCLGFLAGMELTRNHVRQPQSGHGLVLVRRATFVFLAVGGVVKYMFSLPYALGLLPWVLPGSIQHLSSLLGAAIILLFVLVHRGNTRFRWILYPLIVSELISGLMTFSKQEVLWTVLTIILGRYLCRPNLRMLVMSIAGLAIFYALVLSPFVSFARVAVSHSGTDDPRELARSAQMFEEVGRDQLSGMLPGVQGWWTRLAYANAQAFAMEEYDRGEPGSTFGLAIYAFVPRVLYPEKPMMTSGKDFTALVTGEDSYSTAPGIFGEAYWNGGWSALIAAGLYVGLVFAAFTAFSVETMTAGRYIYVPVVMAGIMMGVRPDDWLVPTYIGSVVEILALYCVLKFLLIPLIAPTLGGTRPRAAPPAGSVATKSANRTI